MSLLALMLGWLLARTIRIVPFESGTPAAPPPPPPAPPAPSGVINIPEVTIRPRNGTGPRRNGGTARPTSQPVSVPASPVPRTSAPPWPQVMPRGLAPFPSGWVPFEPPSGAVVARANELLPLLWQGGPGTFKVEQTAGVWVYYRATPMGDKKGVVAFREKSPGASPPAPTAPSGPVVVTPQGPAVPTSASPVALATIRRGSRGNDVVVLQRRLGITADGIFGPGTEAAVIAYQKRNGLVPDGVVGPRTWSSLMAKAA